MPASEYMVVERVVAVSETHDADKNNPGFSGVASETMMLRNYAQKGYRLVSVISERVSDISSRRVFYLTKDNN
jgi:hypothetical protein